MFLRYAMSWLIILTAFAADLAAETLPARPMPADLSLRDAWVRGHFPANASGIGPGILTGHAEALRSSF